jgi:hypothetical protein
MSIENTTASAVDSDTKGLYRAGGISAIVLGICYVVIIGVYVVGGAPPNEAEQWLKYLSRHTTAWWTILGLSVLTDLLFVPVVISLYVALKNVNRNAMLAGAGLVVAFVVLDLAVTWPNYSSLITLSGKYAAATNDAQRTAFVAAAQYASAVLTSTVVGVYAILVPSLGNLIIGLVMLKGTFSKVTAYLAVISGILGIVSVVGPHFVTALGLAIVIGSALTTVWVVLVGYRLYRLGETAS